MKFFEEFRLALERYEAGVHLCGAPAQKAQLAQAEARIDAARFESWFDFLRSFDGASLFHDQIVLYRATDPRAVCAKNASHELCIGESEEGSLWLLPSGAVRRRDEDGDGIIIGTSIESWLAALMAREGTFYDRSGEFLEVFDEQGVPITKVRRKRLKLGRRRDPKAALYDLEEAELLLEDGEKAAALLCLQQAVANDPQAGVAWELCGALTQNEEAFVHAAQATWFGPLRAARFLDAALVIQSETEAARQKQSALAQQALLADPNHSAGLLADAEQSIQRGEQEEAAGLLARLRLLAAACPQTTLGPSIEALSQKLRHRAALRVVA